MANDRDSAGGAETLRQRVAPLPPTLSNARAPVLTRIPGQPPTPATASAWKRGDRACRHRGRAGPRRGPRSRGWPTAPEDYPALSRPLPLCPRPIQGILDAVPSRAHESRRLHLRGEGHG